MTHGRGYGIAIGVFARAPVPGRCKTRLAPVLGLRGAAELYEAMLRDCLDSFDRLRATHKILLAAPEDHGVEILRGFLPRGWELRPQLGDDLGERMTRAFRDLCATGDPVVLLGTDSPTLPLAPLEDALTRFAGPRRALLGPAEDGGYTLLGMTTFEPAILRKVPWSTPAVLSTTRAHCEAQGLALEELPTWYDVDEPADLDRLRAELQSHPERAPRTAKVLAELAKPP